MMGVASKITIKLIAHMDEFLGHNDFHGPWLRLIDTLDVDQHAMGSVPLEEAVGPTIS